MKIIDIWMVHATLPAESLLNEENLAYARNLGRRIFNGESTSPVNVSVPSAVPTSSTCSPAI